MLARPSPYSRCWLSSFAVRTIALLAAALMLASSASAQTYLVNTGPGASTTIGAPSLGGGVFWQYLGARFTLASAATIGTIEGWMARPSGTINVRIYSNSVANKPGTQLFTLGVNGTGTASPGWAVFSGMNWNLSPGTYWVTFEPVSGNGAMPNGAATPLRSHTWQADGSGGWQLQSASSGIRIVAAAPPADIHVPADHATIQAAINAASNGQNIIVADGVYTEAVNFNGKLVNLVSENGADFTTIDATGLNASVVQFVSGENANARLDGFTLTGGAGTLVSGGRRGGGIYCLNSSPTIQNCVILSNHVNNIGGGMRCTTSSPTVIDCTFDDNSAINGGAVSCGSTSNPSFNGCIFVNHSSTASGGAIDNAFSSPSFVDCLFITNHSGSLGGAVYNGNTCSPTFNGCVFEGNTASSGSVMYSSINCHAAFTNCEFVDNDASFAATVFVFDHSNGSYTGCLFENNDGGFFAGGIYLGLVSNPAITNCEFKNNHVTNTGGAIYSEADCNPAISQTWICGNTPNAVFGPWANGGGNNINSSCTPAGDVDGNGHVDTDDLLLMLGDWGACPTPPQPCPADIAVPANGMIDTDDLLLLLGTWG